MKFSILTTLFARRTLRYPRIFNVFIGILILLIVVSVLEMLFSSAPGGLVFIASFNLCILVVFLGHRLHPTKACWLFVTLALTPVLFLFISTLPEVYYRADYLTNYIIGILFCISVIISFSVRDSYVFLKSQKKRIIVPVIFMLYIFFIWLTLGVDQVARDDEVVNFNDFIKHRFTFKIHYKNPSWKGLELISQDKLTQEEQNLHIKYCEVRFGVTDFSECQKKFNENEFPQMEHSSN